MAESGFRGKSMKAVAVDVAEGYVSVNPLFLKKFDKDMVKDLYEHLTKAMTATQEREARSHQPGVGQDQEHEAPAAP